MSITQLTPKELKEYLMQFSTSKLPDYIKKKLIKDEWEITEFGLVKRVVGYHIYIESCVGDYCVSLGSKKTGWLLELPKKRCNNIDIVLQEAKLFEDRIKKGEHWKGEDE